MDRLLHLSLLHLPQTLSASPIIYFKYTGGHAFAVVATKLWNSHCRLVSFKWQLKTYFYKLAFPYYVFTPFYRSICAQYKWMDDCMFESMFVCIVYVDFFNVSFIRTVKHFAAVLLKWVILLHLLSWLTVFQLIQLVLLYWFRLFQITGVLNRFWFSGLIKK